MNIVELIAKHEQKIEKHKQKILLLKQIKQVVQRRETIEAVIKTIPEKLVHTANVYNQKKAEYSKTINQLTESYNKIKTENYNNNNGKSVWENYVDNDRKLGKSIQ